ncbi:hypothetical protein NLJ89_g8706 [Agrocybe chaxingu]|uniref:Xylanolytic transcriptional activator regulatory domain-containing protein n=1 Tax=Agrocybe chaxingu TaxID=84603 RepID=A0A9W8JS65_9AGAR|nr:hypothetical protein NLJ89_g8706 [Agrocybe chaxingu]
MTESDERYIARLEKREKVLEKIIRELCPDDSVYEKWIKALDKESQEAVLDPSHFAQSCNTQAAQSNPVDQLTTAIRIVSDGNIPPAGDENASPSSPRLLDPDSQRFFGTSSNEVLARSAMQLKSQYAGATGLKILPHRREEFWTVQSWEIKPHAATSADFAFPAASLGMSLVNLYFDNVNLYLPLLHRPSFERSVREGLHYTNCHFAAVYMLVCAIGARFSNDPRVFVDGSDHLHSAGWKWFEQVQARKFSPSPLSLYGMQECCLSVLFLQASLDAQSIWAAVGIVIRLAQDVGFHRRKPTSSPPTMEDELWKRAFWVLLYLDATTSALLGRPCAIWEEDYDIDLPIDCDDEHWEHLDPESRFKQPRGEPSLVSAFIQQIKLMQILVFCIRGVASVIFSNVLTLLTTCQEWKSPIVRELDSSLNKWLDSMPDHLRWDPERENNKFFNQSAVLHATYYHIRVLIHRAFIPLPKTPPSLSFPSLMICTNAARACSQIAFSQLQRSTMLPPPPVQMATFASASILLFDLWSNKKHTPRPSQKGNLASVDKCIQVLKAAESRWPQAGRFGDILYELASESGISEDTRQHSEYQSIGTEVDSAFMEDPPLQIYPSPPHDVSFSFRSLTPDVSSLGIGPFGVQQATQNYAARSLNLNKTLRHWSSKRDGEQRHGASAVEGVPLSADDGTLWANAATGFGLDDWDMYLTNVNLFQRSGQSL